MSDGNELITCIPTVHTTVKRFRNTEVENIIPSDKFTIIHINRIKENEKTKQWLGKSKDGKESEEVSFELGKGRRGG